MKNSFRMVYGMRPDVVHKFARRAEKELLPARLLYTKHSSGILDATYPQCIFCLPILDLLHNLSCFDEVALVFSRSWL